MYMEEQFGLPEGLSVMDVITRYKQAGSKNVNSKASKLLFYSCFNASISNASRNKTLK